MSDPRTTDRQPGRRPDVRTQGDGVVYRLKIDVDIEAVQYFELIIRCDDNGDVWSSLTHVAEPTSRT
jgi:hypothetical protein